MTAQQILAEANAQEAQRKGETGGRILAAQRAMSGAPRCRRRVRARQLTARLVGFLCRRRVVGELRRLRPSHLRHTRRAVDSLPLVDRRPSDTSP